MRNRSRSKGALIVYLNEGVSPTRANQCTQKLYGQSSSSRGRKYHRKGVLESLPHWRVKRGVILVRADDREKVVRVLKGLVQEIHWWPVPLRPRDRQLLNRQAGT